MPLNVSGEWSAEFNWPLIGLQACLTPDGKVLSYGTDADGTQTGLHIYDVWDPVTNTHQTLANTTGTDCFCSACIIIPGTDQILVTGGDARPQGVVNAGVPDSNVFDAATHDLTHNPTGSMEFARWYPSLVTLDTGQLLVLGGRDLQNNYVPYPEIFTPGYGWRTLTGAYIAEYNTLSNYPRTWEASDGKIISFSPHGVISNVYAIDTSGNGSVAVVGQLPAIISWNKPAIMYAVDKALLLADDGSVWIMDMSAPQVKFTQTAGLGTNLDWSNMVVLPNGSVMLSGGSAVDNQLTNVNYTAEIWNPHTGTWTAAADAAIARLYHSDTLLLPDGTILSLGGGAPGPLVNTNGEIYSPSYLFDANGNAAVRPVILQAPHELDAGQTFTLKVDNPASITTLALMPFGAVTHSFDMTARRIELPFTQQADGTLKVTLPTNSAVLLPGYWMLFAINANGTPSVAATIQIQTDAPYHLPSTPPLSLGPIKMVGAVNGIYEGYDDAYALTPNDINKVGADWSSQRVDLSKAFAINFALKLGAVGGITDGITFMLQNDPAGTAAIGGAGGNLGAAGIANGFGIKFDTYDNTDLPNEIAAPHTNFFATQGANTNWAVSNATAVPGIVDGNWHNVIVTSNGANVTYSVDGVTIGTTTLAAVKGYLGGSQYAYFGFTGAAGGAAGEQLVRIDKINATLESGAVENVDRAALPHAEAFNLNGSATFSPTLDTWQLTSNVQLQKGSVMSVDRVDLRQAFDVTFKVNVGNDPNGADGMAFVLHNDPAGTKALGYEGGNLGAFGIVNGFGIKLDTFDNPGMVNEIPGSHTNFFTTDPVTGRWDVSPATPITLTDGLWHIVNVSSNGKNLTYTVDGTAIATIAIATVEADVGGQPYAYFGFTGATGGATQVQRLQVLSLNATAENGTSVHIDGYDTPPVAANDSYTVGVNGVLTVDAAHGVLANDSDPLGNQLTVTANSHITSNVPLLQPAHGTLAMNADGSFTYIPTAGFAGVDSFVYSVDDNYSGSLATATITVGGGGGGGGSTISTGGALADTVSVGSAIVKRDLLTGAVDSSGAAMSLANLTGLSAGLTVGADGHTLSIDPGNAAFRNIASGAQQTIALGYNITDAGGSSTPQIETVTVVGVNHAPLLDINGQAALVAGIADQFNLTPNAPLQKGSVMSDTRVDLTKVFDVSFSFNFGNNPNAADGLAFVLHNDPAGNKALGYEGGNLGASGIKNGIGVVFDIYQGKQPYLQIAQDHTNIIATSNIATNPDITPETSVGNGNLKDGNWHNVLLHWDGQQLSYTVDGVSEAGLTKAQLTQYLGGSQFAYFGFTGATGGGTTTNTVHLNGLAATAENGGLYSFEGGGGNDVFTFQPGFGRQTLTNFHPGTAAGHDTLDLTGLGFTSVQNVLDNTDAGAVAVIHAGADSITLAGITKAQLQAFDILVGGGGAGGGGGSSITVTGALADKVTVGGAIVQHDLLAGAVDSSGAAMNVVNLTGLVPGLSLAADGHTISIDPGNIAFRSIANGAQQAITLAYNIMDAAGATTPQTETVTVVGVNHSPVLDLNGQAAAVAGIANEYNLTPNAPLQKGSVMSDTRVDLTKVFDVSFSFNFGNNPNAADGLAFVLHNDPAGNKALGYEGGNLGASGIKNGIGVVFDIYQGKQPYLQIAQDHTNIIATSNIATNPDITPETSVGNGNLKDGNWHNVLLHWDGQQLSYTVDGVSEAGLTKAQLTQYLGGSQFAYFGFTGATGGGTTTNTVQLNSLAATTEAGAQLGLATGNGNDVFQFKPGFGQQTLANFHPGTAAIHDTLDLTGLGFTSVQDVLTHTDAGANAVIHAGTDTITLTGITKAQLQTFDFLA